MFVLLCVSLLAPNMVNAQNAFTPISKSSYSRSQEFFDEYFDDYSLAIVNFMMTYSLVPEPFVSLSLRMNYDKSNGIITVRTKNNKYSMECNPELYSSLIHLTKHAVNTSSFTMDRTGVDGATYYLFYDDNGVTTWSPDGITDYVVRLFEHIGTSVMAGDRERLESFNAVADYLQNEFRKYYHEDNLRTDRGVSSRPPEKVQTLSLYADLGSDFSTMLTYCDQGGFQLQFKFDDDSFKEEYREQYSEKYDNLLRKLGYWIFVQSDFADDSNYATFIVDESVKSKRRVRASLR